MILICHFWRQANNYIRELDNLKTSTSQNLPDKPVLVLPSPPPRKNAKSCSLGSLPYFHKPPYFQPLIRFGMSVRVINKLHHLQRIKRFCSLKYVHIVHLHAEKTGRSIYFL